MLNIIRNYFSNINYFHIFFSLFLISLVSGPLIPEILMLILIIFFFKENKFSIKYFYSNRILFVLLIFYLYLNLNSIFFSFDVSISLKSTLPFIRLILLSYIIFNLLLSDKDQIFIKLIIFSYLILLILFIIDSLIQTATGYNIFGFGYQHGRITSFFGSEQILGSFVVRTFPIIIAFLYLIENINKKLIFSVFLFSGILILLSAERTSLAYFIIFLTSFLFIESKNLKKFLVLIIISYIFIISFISLHEPLKKRIINSTVNQIKSSSFFLIPSYRHELHYTNAIYLFKDNLLFGKGIKSFRYVCKNYDKEIQKKIINDKSVFAVNDGYGFFLNTNIIRNIIFIDKNMSKIDFDKNVIYKKYYLDKDFRSTFLKLNDKIKTIKNLDQLSFDDLSHDKVINKNDFLFANFEFSTGCNTHPHNIFLQFMSELGIFGIIFYMIGIIFLIYNIFKIIYFKLRNNQISVIYKGTFIVTVSLLLSFLPIFPSGNFFNNWLSMIFFFKIGVLLFFLKKKYNY